MDCPLVLRVLKKVQRFAVGDTEIEPVSGIDPPGVDNNQVVDFAQQKFVNDVGFGNKVGILATTLPQFF